LTDHEVKGIASSNGPVSATIVGNLGSKRVTTTVSGLPEPLEIQGEGKLILEGYSFEKIERQLTQLKSWTEDPETKNFSGTGRYLFQVQIPDVYVKPGVEVALDLGVVGNVAEVMAWMQPYVFDVTQVLKPGTNRLEILVTNTLINYVSGLNALPEMPDNLIPEYGSTFGTYKSGEMAWKHNEKGFNPLPQSGLIGAVRFVPRCKVTIPIT
jgi:hypothetical protein